MSVLFTGANPGDVADATAYSANWNLLETSLLDLGPYAITGLVPSIGTGLAVSVTAGTASIGGHVNEPATFSIASLTPSATNHLYLLQTGLGSANTTGTAPANSVKLGTCVTNATNVTSVATNWASGRQQFVQPQSLVHGSGAGNPRSLNLASWAASGNEGQECIGVLPAGAIPGTLGALVLSLTDAGTNTVPVVLQLNHLSTSTPAANFGASIDIRLHDATNVLTDAVAMNAYWTAATHGAVSSALDFYVIGAGAAALVMTIDGASQTLKVPQNLAHTNAAGHVGFFGAATVVQQPNASQADITAVTDTHAKSALQALYNLLKNYGLAPATA